MTQIWVAICSYLLFAYIKFLSQIDHSLQQLLRLIQLNLFERRDMKSLLRGDPPPPDISSDQIGLKFS